jgi:hypothetical protein
VFAKLARAQPQQLQQQFKSSGIAAAASNSVPDADSQVAPLKKTSQQAAFSFRVTGTNVTLGKPVVIEGTYFATSPPIGRAGFAGAAAKDAGSAPAAQIQGRAQIGTGPKMDISAESVILKTRTQQ